MASWFLIFLSQVPLNPTDNHLDGRKDSREPRYTLQSDPLGVHSFSTPFLWFSLGPLQSLRMACILQETYFLQKQTAPFSKHCSSFGHQICTVSQSSCCSSASHPLTEILFRNALLSSPIVGTIPRHPNPLLWSTKICRSLSQGKHIVIFSAAEKTYRLALPHIQKTVRGKNRKPIFPSVP